MSANIFHDYDVRGRYPGEVNETVFYNLGLAVGRVFKSKKIAVGRDARLSSDILSLYLAAGLASQKIKVVDLGRVSTPLGLWYARYYKTDTLVVTASHNPADQNGLKIFSAKPAAAEKSILLKIKSKFHKLDAAWQRPAQPAKLIRPPCNHRREYTDFILKLAGKFPPLKTKIALDFSHGTAGPEFGAVLEKLKIDFATLNEAPNGNFPAHGPNPLEEVSQRGARTLMKTGKFGLGAVVDGDGDRILFLDENGEVVDPAYIFSLLMDCYASRFKAPTVVKGVSVAQIADEVAAAAGIKLIASKVGRTNIRRMMKKRNAVLGVEKSGHYFFKDFYYGDSSLLALLAVWGVMAREKKKLSRLTAPYRRYLILPEISLPFEGHVDRIMGALKKRYQNGKIDELDGLTVEYVGNAASWRFNLRRSHTEKVWRLNLEGSDQNKLDSIKKEIESIITF